MSSRHRRRRRRRENPMCQCQTKNMHGYAWEKYFQMWNIVVLINFVERTEKILVQWDYDTLSLPPKGMRYESSYTHSIQSCMLHCDSALRQLEAHSCLFRPTSNERTMDQQVLIPRGKIFAGKSAFN